MTRIFAIVLASLSLVAIAGCGGSSSPNFSTHIEHSIINSGSSQLQADYGKDVGITDANCIQQTSTQAYSCVAHVLASNGLGQTYARSLAIQASCQNDGSCVWNTR